MLHRSFEVFCLADLHSVVVMSFSHGRMQSFRPSFTPKEFPQRPNLQECHNDCILMLWKNENYILRPYRHSSSTDKDCIISRSSCILGLFLHFKKLLF